MAKENAIIEKEISWKGKTIVARNGCLHVPRNSLEKSFLEMSSQVDLSGITSIVIDTPVENTRGFEDLDHVEEIIFKGTNNIKKIEGFDKLTRLEVLEIFLGKVERMGGLEHLHRLKRLGLSGSFRSIESVSNLESLERLNIGPSITSLEGIGDLPDPGRMNHLGIGGTFEKIECLERLVNLHYLSLRGNLRKISGLDNLSKMEVLNLPSNGISTIDGLDTLSTLKTLNLKDNQIERIEGLDALRNLRHLDLSGNKIEKIEGLGGLENLKELHLEQNQITSLRGLEECPGLTDFDDSDLIENEDGYIPVDPLVDGLQALHAIWLQDNRIGEEAVKEALQDDKLLPFLLHVNLQGNPGENMLDPKIAGFVDLIKAVMKDMRDKEKSRKYYDEHGGANVYINFSDEIAWKSNYGPGEGLSARAFSECFADWLAVGKAPLEFKYEHEDSHEKSLDRDVLLEVFFTPQQSDGKRKLTYRLFIKTMDSLWDLV